MAEQAGRKRVVTIHDVAARASVSVSTVSKALSGGGHLRPATRERVAAAAAELGYRSNALAKNLLTGRSFSVGMITNDSYGRFALPVLLAAEDVLQERGQIAVLLCDGRDEPAREQRYLDMLLARRVDGLIITGRRDDLRPPIGHDLPVPVVYAMAESTDSNDVSVLPDDEGGGRLAVKLLLDAGRSRVAHVTGPVDFRAVRQRVRGACLALEEAGLGLLGEVRYGQWSEAAGRQAAEQLLAEHPEVDAIFCGSDQVARGVADALRDRGRRVPDDVAIVGFDNWTVMADACRPPLTTIDMNLPGIGQRAAELLLQAIDGTVKPGVHLVDCSIVRRESTPQQETDELHPRPASSTRRTRQ